MSYAVGVDIGGTKVAIGVVDQQGEVKSKKIIKTNLEITPVELLYEVIAVVKQQLRELKVHESEVAGIGIGAPGPVDVKKKG